MAGGIVNQSANQISAMTRFFSSTVFRELARTGRSATFRRLVEFTDIGSGLDPRATVADVFEAAFSKLKRAGARDEYIYRAALTQKVLLGTHNLRTASMLSEFRVGACKADVVILNGTSTVYEIKSERDTLVRLANQIDNYKCVFAAVNVITCEKYIDEVCRMVPEDVGILCLSNRYKITAVRNAVENLCRICPLSVFESLRTDEASAILRALDIEVPDVPNTQRRGEMRARYAKLDPVSLHPVFLSTLKRSRDLAPLSELVGQIPRSLHAAALSFPLRRVDHFQLARVLQAPLATTVCWAR